MSVITEIHTDKIVSDTDSSFEYLYEDGHGYTKHTETIEHKPVDTADKLVVTVSSQKFCDDPKLGFHGNASTLELVSEITTEIILSGIKHGSRLNVYYTRMGEPTFNYNVITSARLIAEMLAMPNSITFDTYYPVISTMMPKSNKNLNDFLHMWIETGFEFGDEDGFGLQFSINTLDEDQRNKMFDNKSLSLQEISDIIKTLPMPKKCKYTLNFEVTSECNLDVNLMNKYFDKEKCIVKITPIHETVEVVKERYKIVTKIVTDFDVYEKFEQPLVKDGWDVIVSVPSNKEDTDCITCGN